MKKYVLFMALGMLAWSCTAPEQEAEATPPVLEDGAYSLTNGSWTYPDSLYEFEPQQIKIYAGGRYMFATWNEANNTPAMGAGAAWSENGMMYEQPYHNANGATDSSQTFELSITATESGFEQNIQGIDLNDSTKVDLYENWVALEGEATPYDGLWVLTSRNEIEGINDFQEIKMIGGGHFVWYHTWSDTLDHADFGYGQFIDNGDGTATEVAQVGSINGYEGEWSINYTLVGSDMLQQSYINNTDSTEVFQNYKRL
jgi:hypothetical protein